MTSLPSLKDLEAALKSSSRNDAKKYFGSLLRGTREQAGPIGKLLISVKDSLLQNTNMSSLLVDMVWMETSLVHQEGQPTDTGDLGVTVKAIVTALPELRLQWLETLDAPWLQTVGIVPTEAELQKKIRLTNTQQFYRQHKFNLMAEVSEGYAKLLYFLGHEDDGFDEKDDDTTLIGKDQLQHHLKETLYALIGTFSLDPNRCLDIALDVLEDCLDGTTTLPNKATVSTSSSKDLRLQRITTLVRLLHTDKITAIIAFKLKERDREKNLLRCVVYLFGQKLIDLVDMLTFFPEWFDPLQEMCKEHRKRERKRIRSLGKVRLSGASPSADLVETLDLGPLETHLTTQLIFVFLEWNLFAEIEDIFQECWSDLCQIFPVKIGTHICDWVQKELNSSSCASLITGIQLEDGETATAMEIDDVTADSPVQRSAADMVRSITTRLAYTKESGCISLRPALFSQLWRFVSHYMEKNDAKEECLALVEDFLLPSLSAFQSNSAINLEAWKAIKHFPCRTRYAWYGKWRGTGLGRDAMSSDKPLWLIESELQAAKDARYFLKRLSKDTVRDISRSIAKISHSHPLVVFSIILSTIESYDNMIKVMVDSMRFVAPLSLDVLCFCILNRLTGSVGGVNRSRLKEDGVNVSQWLQSLETFIGALCRKFPSLEVKGIISYLILRLRKGEVMELGVLRTVLKTSAGWAFADYAPAASLSTAQLEGRAGSVLLKRETMSFGVFEDFCPHASASMRNVLQSDNFGTALLVLLAQVHHHIIFEGQGRAKPIKLIGNLVDSCQVTMAILLDFLTDSAIEKSVTQGSPPDAALTLAKSMPSLIDLIQTFELDLSSLWMLCRPLIRAATCQQEQSDEEDFGKLADFVLQDSVRKAYMAEYPDHTWKEITCELYEIFYTQTLFDVFLPDDSYKTEIARLEREVDSKSRTKNESDVPYIQRMKRVKADLSADWNKQRHHVESVRSRVKGMIASFFPSEQVTAEAMTTFFTRCIFPRCMQGPEDALYCAQFISMLHSFETPGFGTLQLYDLMIASLSRSVFGLTEGEAANVSILLETVWKKVSHWRYDEDAFAEEVYGKIGSFVKTEEGEMATATAENFAILYNKWHASLGATMLGCLKSSEYMHCRNSLIILSRMVETYPTRPTLANRLLHALKPLQEEGFAFADIRASAQAYSTQLVKARDEGVWKEESESAKEARKAQEKAAAAARQKKAEAQMEQFKRDSQKITDEIGERESWDQRRSGRVPIRRDREDDRRSGPLPARDERENPHRDDKWARREPTGNAPNPARRDAIREEGARKGDDRWQRGTEQPTRAGEGLRGSKRSRASSPVDNLESGRDETSRTSKRPRVEVAEEGAILDESAGRRLRKRVHHRR